MLEQNDDWFLEFGNFRISVVVLMEEKARMDDIWKL